jgi:GDP-mannose 6-dehydrogenase
MKVAIFGLGYVGTVTAGLLAANGHEVVGVDVDRFKVDAINEARSPVVEPGLDSVVANAVAGGTLRATVSVTEALKEAEISLVCVGTPSSPRGDTDLAHVLRAIRDITSALLTCESIDPGRYHAVIIRSTVPPRTMARTIAPLVAGLMGTSSVTVGLGMCPEFLREGTAINDFYDAPLSVIGTEDDHLAAKVKSLFAFLDSPIETVPTDVAEALKIACNAFHATKISFANEIGRLLRGLGVDSRSVMDLFCKDTKLNVSRAYLEPGFAFGGSCLPKDLRSLLYIARMNCLDLPLLSGALATNQLAIGDVVERVVASDARTVALLGLSFKMDSDDLRESPFVDLAETLLGKGFEVQIFDPIVDSNQRLVGANRRYVDERLPHLRRALHRNASDALRGADLALVSSSDDHVVEALLKSPPRTLIDLCGRLGPSIEGLPGYQGVAW